METKRCTKCGEVKGLEEFYRRSSVSNGTFRAECKVCSRACSRACKGVKDPVKAKEERARFRTNSRGKYLEGKRRETKRATDEVKPRYVRLLLGEKATPELIEMKRQQILAYRALKEFQKLLKEQTK